jgi:hypothetical protein
VICSEGGLFSANLNDLALFVQIESVASEGYGWYSCWGALTFYRGSKVNEVGRRIRGGKEKEKDKRGNKGESVGAERINEYFCNATLSVRWVWPV